jgi:hypothetical protein
MNSIKPKVPKTGAVKKLREFYERNRGYATPELIDILKTPSTEKSKNKKSAKSRADEDVEL